MTRVRHVPIAARLSALVLLAAVAACGGSESDANAETAAATPTRVSPENIAVVRAAEVQAGPTLSGSLVAEHEAAVAAQISATVLSTHAEVGQRVTRGQLLARLDGRTLEEAVRSARSALRSAQVTADNARREVARQERLLAVEAVAESAVETARGTLATADAGLADARSRLASAEAQARFATITAPITGVVSQRAASAGSAVQVGGALFTIMDPSSMRLEASVPAEALAGIRVGTPVEFRVRGYADRVVAGKITRVSPAADPATRQVQVFATIPNAGAALVSGLFASGRVVTETSSGPVIPLGAVDGRDVAPTVSRVRGGAVERVRVELGLRDESTQRVRVAAGLAPGDTVLTGTAVQLAAGTRLAITSGSITPGDAPAAPNTATPNTAAGR